MLAGEEGWGVVGSTEPSTSALYRRDDPDTPARMVEHLRRGGEEAKAAVVAWLLARDAAELATDALFSRVVQAAVTAAPLARCRPELLRQLAAQLPRLAGHALGNLAVLAALDTADPLHRRAFVSRLGEEDTLVTLLSTDTGAFVAECMVAGEVDERTAAAVTELLLPRLAELATLPAAARFLQGFLERQAAAGHRLALHLCLDTSLALLVPHATGHAIISTLVTTDEGAATLAVAYWLERHMVEVLGSPHAAAVAAAVLHRLLDHSAEPGYRSMLAGWVSCLTSGPRPLLVAAALAASWHLLAVALVTQQSLPGERRRAVAVVRAHLALLTASPTGCVVVRAAQGWL